MRDVSNLRSKDGKEAPFFNAAAGMHPVLGKASEEGGRGGGGWAEREARLAGRRAFEAPLPNPSPF
jgi:hypothetical protein